MNDNPGVPRSSFAGEPFPSLVSDECDLRQIAEFAIACAEFAVRLKDQIAFLEERILALEGKKPS